MINSKLKTTKNRYFKTFSVQKLSQCIEMIVTARLGTEKYVTDY